MKNKDKKLSDEQIKKLKNDKQKQVDTNQIVRK